MFDGQQMTRSGPPTHNQTPSKSETAMDTATTVLTILNNAALYSPVPYLREASVLALGILNIAQSAKDNKTAFRRLANHACQLVCTALYMCEEAELNGTTLCENLKDLIETLRCVEVFARKKVERTMLVRMISFQSDSGKIQEYRDMLRQALDVFVLQSNISLRNTLSHIFERQKELALDVQEWKDRMH